MLSEEKFYEESLDNNLYYLRTLRDFCISIQLSFPNDNEYKRRAGTLATASQNLGREIVTYTKGDIPRRGITYQIYYTKYTLPVEILTEELFSINLGTDITEELKKLTPKETFEVSDQDVITMTDFNNRALSIANNFLALVDDIIEQQTTNNLFSYLYPALYSFMKLTINLYIVELERLNQKIAKDPITALDTEYGYNITSYEIVSFSRGLIDPNATTYIESLNEILNVKYKSLLEDYNNLPLSPINQKSLTDRSIAIIREIKLLLSSMLEDLLNSKLYFIIAPLAIDTFYRNINYFLYILNEESEEV